MSQRKAVSPAPGLLEEYAQGFDDLFGKRNQREGFRRYVEGLLLPGERNKTLTGLVNTEPVVGANEARAQSLQWYLSESTWDSVAVNERRLELLVSNQALAPHATGVLVIDETGDRKDGHKTAHVGRQYLANLGKIDNGVVSVSSLWADERVYYPIDVEPYTPASWFERGKADPAFRTKLKIATELVERAKARNIAFAAVVADSFYGEDRSFRQGLEDLKVGYVLALKPSFSWWHRLGDIGSLQEAAFASPWLDPQQPGAWQAVERTFRDGHTETWWALDVQVGPFGAQRSHRGVVVTTDPLTLPPLQTWYLISNLSTATLPQIVRLYGLRMWVEQSYKQVKLTLGWSQYQVRSDIAIRRHWIVVCCAFCFCWWQAALQAAIAPPQVETTPDLSSSKKTQRFSPTPVLASRFTSRQSLSGTLYHAQALLASLFPAAPAAVFSTTP
jgi:hypothetical protein